MVYDFIPTQAGRGLRPSHLPRPGSCFRDSAIRRPPPTHPAGRAPGALEACGCLDQKYPPYPNFHGFCHHFCHNSLVFIAFLKDSFCHKCHEYPPSLIAASLQPPRLWAGACHLHWQPQLFSIKTFRPGSSSAGAYGGDAFRDVMWLKQYI